MSKQPLASVIIPVRNGWKMTRQCLQSLKQHTAISYEVLLVDNGSEERPPADLANAPHLHLIRNRWNQGFAAAINLGLERAQGRYLVWLNNDTLPSHRCLQQLIEVLQTDDRVGAVGPVSNKVIPEQKISVSLKSLERIHSFSQKFNRTNRDKWKKTLRLSGFCLMYSRHVFEKVGYLDERFGLGTYEDDDYCYRIRQAGYRLVVAGDTYVHHFGSQSFRKNGYREFQKILLQNRRYYMNKWNRKPEGVT